MQLNIYEGGVAPKKCGLRFLNNMDAFLPVYTFADLSNHKATNKLTCINKQSKGVILCWIEQLNIEYDFIL